MRIKTEISKFLKLKDDFISRGMATSIDDYGFKFKSHPGAVDLMLTGLIHGDEVVGIEAFNILLEEMSQGLYKTNLNVGFLLGNVEAALIEKRYVEKDLNRSFGLSESKNAEEARAVVIGKAIDGARYLVDLHQTIFACERPFLIFEHQPQLVGLAHHLLPDLSIVTFSQGGFSRAGKTMGEFARGQNCKSVSVEFGQKGFSIEQANSAVKSIKTVVSKIPSIPESFSGRYKVFNLERAIQTTADRELVPGLASMMRVTAGQVLGHDKDGPVTSPYDGIILFPRYGDVARSGPELCQIGKPILVEV